MKIIEVKTHPKYLASAISGEKTFTVRKNDHDYEVGGVIRKMGYTPDKGYTGEYADFKITYILTHADFPDGIKEWYIVCGIKLISKEKGVRKMNEKEITRPSHYTDGKIEVIEYILDKGMDFCSGNVIKYISRAGKKKDSDRLSDLKKARQYIEFLINDEVKKQTELANKRAKK